MLYVIIFALVVCLLIVAFVVYPWCAKDENQANGTASRIVVEVWYLNEDEKQYRFWEEVYMEEWLKTNKRLVSEIDPVMAEKYMSASWIAWKFDTALPLPAAEMSLTKKGSRFESFCVNDLSGPYGYEPLDSRVVR